MATALELLRNEINHPHNQDVPLESIKDLLGRLVDEVESDMNGPIIRGPFSFTYDTPGLLEGWEIGYSPAVGDAILSGWFDIAEPWDGTSPFGDYGYYINSQQGLGKVLAGGYENAMDLANNQNTGLPLDGFSYSYNYTIPNGYLSPAIVTESHPLKVVVSQDGEANGNDPGASQGAASLYIMTATLAS